MLRRLFQILIIMSILILLGSLVLGLVDIFEGHSFNNMILAFLLGLTPISIILIIQYIIFASIHPLHLFINQSK